MTDRFTSDERALLTRLLRRNDRRADDLRRRRRRAIRDDSRAQLTALIEETGRDSLALRRMLTDGQP